MKEKIIQAEVKSIKEKDTLKIPKIIFIATMVILIASSLSSFIFEQGVFLWYIGAPLAIFSPFLFLIVGAITFNRGGKNLMKFAALFLAVSILVGFGTCYVNMFSIGG